MLNSVKLSTGRYDRPSSYQTQVEGDADKGRCVYRGTTIVWWDRDAVILATGGYSSATTKRKMNQVSHMFALGFRVFQKNGIWYVVTQAHNVPLCVEYGNALCGMHKIERPRPLVTRGQHDESH